METVYNFLKDNSGVAYSTTTIAKQCNIKRSRVNAYLRYMNDIVQVDPLSVGSNKKTINVFRWNN